LPSNTSSKGCPPERTFLDPKEIDAALDALSREDRLRLHAAEAKYRRGTRFDPGKLFEEVCDRAKDGRRRCPKDVRFMAFLIMTMRSIASQDRTQHRKTLQLVPRHEESVAPSDLPAYQTPEDRLIEQQEADMMKRMVMRVYDRLSDKPEAQHVIQEWVDGLKGSEVRDAIGLTQAKYDYAMKCIRALMKRLYPGWKP
jgi:hypothetical protein